MRKQILLNSSNTDKMKNESIKKLWLCRVEKLPITIEINLSFSITISKLTSKQYLRLNAIYFHDHYDNDNYH